MSVAYSPNGFQIASVGRFEGKVKLWDATTGKELATLPWKKTKFVRTPLVFCVAFSPDGSRIASGGGPGDENITIWDPAEIVTRASAEKR
jgi:WD40 repeat protein